VSEVEAKKRIAYLTREIKAADAFYYQEDAPVMTDAAYDALRKELIALETEFPHLAAKVSSSAARRGAMEKSAKTLPRTSLH